MPGIGAVLNIAKEALMSHQASIGVAGHNVANIDTPGFSRQTVSLETNIATRTPVGYFGNGVRANNVSRSYDQFMVKRLMNQNASVNNLESMQNSMAVIETVFNEAPGLAINDLMSKLWESWQSLSNNPELSASRQDVVQQGELLSEQFYVMNSELATLRSDISVNLKNSLADVNEISRQISIINGQITASETTQQQQNDLRDSRDELLKSLSSLVDVNYFEGTNKDYTVIMNDGHTLVSGKSSWSLDWSNNSVNWLSTNNVGIVTRHELNNDDQLGGKIGALVSINNQLIEGNPDNYLGRIDALANSIIREVNQQHIQGVGTTIFSNTLTSAEEAKNTILLQSTVNVSTAINTIEAGTMKINNREVGTIKGAPVINGLAMGKAYNAVQAINQAYAGAEARLTTMVAGNAITVGLNATESVSFSVNGINVSYTAAANETAAQTTANVVGTINTAIANYNNSVGLTAPQQNTPAMTIEAIEGNGLNGGAINSIIMRNANEGDESRIIIGDIEINPASPSYAIENNLGLTNATYVADATHNTGEISLFENNGPLLINGGVDDLLLTQLGWGSVIKYADTAAAAPAVDTLTSFKINGVSVNASLLAADTAAQTAKKIVDAINLSQDISGVSAEIGNGTNGGVTSSVVLQSSTTNIITTGATAFNASLGFSDFTKKGVSAADTLPNDGKLIYEYVDNGVSNSLMGYEYADQLITDSTNFKMWIYNTDSTLALPQPVSVSMERAYTLNDVADAINRSIVNAIDDPTITTPWIQATVANNKLVLTPDSSHQFAFGGDTSNFLATAGLNTFFTGSNASDIEVNSIISSDLTKLAAGTINTFGEIFNGDNSNNLKITEIQRKEQIFFYGGTTDTLDDHYNTLVTDIGLKSKSTSIELEYNEQVNDQLKIMRDSTSGVSLDEEMANLIKYQHAFSASAKLITISDEMLQTLLNAV